MFYSHEVLTSRKYGVATVWLVATLGSQSSLKKVSRKAILDVDVQKACETIVTPQAPMALRLQSNLLYGVTRVYSQQCGYVLHDAETARNNMRVLLKVLRTSTLEGEGANKGRADQLVLQDDPNFLPDFDLMPLDLDLDMTTEESQGSTLSPYNSQVTDAGIGSQYDIGGIVIPPSSSLQGGPVGGGFSGFSVRGDSGAGTRRDVGGLDDDLGLVIGEDGGLIMPDEPVRQARTPAFGGGRTDVASASSRGRRDDGTQTGQNVLGQPEDDGYLPMLDDDVLVPRTDPMAFRQDDEAEPQQITSEETAEAPLRRRARTRPKIVHFDDTMELRNGDLACWHKDYITNMTDAIRKQNASKASTLAKKNAEYWILSHGDEGPLSIFTGAKLLEALTGINFRGGGKKRAHEAEESESDRRVRARGKTWSDEIGRGLGDDGYMPMMEEDTVEQGREAPTPLDDRQISSMMPWNQSNGSRRPTGIFGPTGVPGSTSVGGPAPQLGSLPRRGSRLASASPLIGRGIAISDDDDFQLPGFQRDVMMSGADAFELYGPAAQVDTQTAEQSQWQRAVLDGESLHFLEFVQAGIEDLDQAREQAVMGDEEDETLKGTVDFDVLLPPQNHTRIVAAQALLHVLTLGTKNLLVVEQNESFGPITMAVVGSQ